jgi:hypothetical protein
MGLVGNEMDAENFRHKARECEYLAETTTNEHIVEEYRKLAKQWRELADQVERHNLDLQQSKSRT